MGVQWIQHQVLPLLGWNLKSWQQHVGNQIHRRQQWRWHGWHKDRVTCTLCRCRIFQQQGSQPWSMLAIYTQGKFHQLPENCRMSEGDKSMSHNCIINTQYFNIYIQYCNWICEWIQCVYGYGYQNEDIGYQEWKIGFKNSGWMKTMVMGSNLINWQRCAGGTAPVVGTVLLIL